MFFFSFSYGLALPEPPMQPLQQAFEKLSEFH